MSNDNKAKFMALSNLHITNLNRILKNIKSNVRADFVWLDQHELDITTNKVILPPNLQTIEKYIKNVNNMDFNNISTSYLLQSKSYLKIIDIPYPMKNSNMPIDFSMIKIILKNIYFFNDISLAFKSKVIKASPKSDIVIV